MRNAGLRPSAFAAAVPVIKPQVKGRVDNNAFAVMAAVVKTLKRAGREDEVTAYLDEATSGSYLHLLQVSMEYVDFEILM